MPNSFKLFLCLYFLILNSSIAQNNPENLNNFSDTSVVFLGYDLSHAKILDAKRVGMQSGPTLAAINNYLRKSFSDQKIKYQLPVLNVHLNYNATDLVNNNIDIANVVTTGKQLLPADSIQEYVNRYALDGLNGTAAVIMFEYFGRKTKTTAAYLVFVELPSKKVTRLEYVRSYDGNSYRKLSDWNYAAYIASVRLFAKFAAKKDSAAHAISSNEAAFEPTIFKKTYNELPVTFVIGPVLGFSSSLISGGVTADMDIKHILIGGRILVHPLVYFMSDETKIEKSIYAGYRYRKNKQMASFGVGYGLVSYSCHEDGYFCENYKSETIGTFPVYIAYDFFAVPYVGFGISMNVDITSRSSQFAVLAGIKFGIAWD